MSPLNAAFLELEDADQNASLAIAPIAILEGPPPRMSNTGRPLAGVEVTVTGWVDSYEPVA